MNTVKPLKATWLGRPGIRREWRQGGALGLRVVETHWQDTNTRTVRVLTGDGRYEGAATIHAFRGEDVATEDTAAELVLKYLGERIEA